MQGFVVPDASNQNRAVPGLTRDLLEGRVARRSRVKPGTAGFWLIGPDQGKQV